jgi:hypothetical protein
MDCAAASALLLVLRSGCYVDAEGARAVEGALFDNNKKRETSAIVGPRGDDPILDPAPVARLLRLPLSTAASLVAGIASVFAGVRLGVLADGLPPARAPALAGLLLPSSSSIGRGDVAVLTMGHVVFVVNVRTLVAAAIATRRHGRALRARTVVPPTGAGHHSHALLLPTPMPVPVACGSHLRRPCLLPRQAQAEWYTRLGDAASVLVRRVLASRHRPSAASGPAAAVAAAAAAAAVATVEVEELGGTCPVAVCALLLGFPVAYDTQWPYGVSRGEGGVEGGGGGRRGGGLPPGPIGSNCLGCVDLVLHSATIRGGDDVVAFSVPASLSSDASVRTALWRWGKGMRTMCEDRGEGGGTVALTATAENRPSVAL